MRSLIISLLLVTLISKSVSYDYTKRWMTIYRGIGRDSSNNDNPNEWYHLMRYTQVTPTTMSQKKDTSCTGAFDGCHGDYNNINEPEFENNRGDNSFKYLLIADDCQEPSTCVYKKAKKGSDYTATISSLTDSDDEYDAIYEKYMLGQDWKSSMHYVAWDILHQVDDFTDTGIAGPGCDRTHDYGVGDPTINVNEDVNLMYDFKIRFFACEDDAINFWDYLELDTDPTRIMYNPETDLFVTYNAVSGSPNTGSTPWDSHSSGYFNMQCP